MGIMSRFVRVCKADLHGVIDQMEDKGLLLKQHLREMEQALEVKEAELARLRNRAEQAAKETQRLGAECSRLEQDLDLALDKDKDDIARMLIRKLKPLEKHRDELLEHARDLEQSAAGLAGLYDEQKLIYEQLKLKAEQNMRDMSARQWRETAKAAVPAGAVSGGDMLDEEVELELLHRKEAAKAKTGKGGSKGGEGK